MKLSETPSWRWCVAICTQNAAKLTLSSQQLAREASEQVAKGETKTGGPVEEAHGDTDTPASTSDLVKEKLDDKENEDEE